MTHEDEQIMILAQLNGNWYQAGFRFSLACEGKCLETLKDDTFSMISDIARRNLIKQSKEELIMKDEI